MMAGVVSRECSLKIIHRLNYTHTHTPTAGKFIALWRMEIKVQHQEKLREMIKTIFLAATMYIVSPALPAHKLITFQYERVELISSHGAWS